MSGNGNESSDHDVGDPIHNPDTVESASGSHELASGGHAAADGGDDESTVEWADLVAQRDEARDQVLRGQAEMDNMRKRLRREAEEIRKYAPLPLVSDLLGVVDNLQRAVEAARGGSLDGLLEGVEMVAQQLAEALGRNGCAVIAGEGAEFDPNVHEAVMQQPSQSVPAGQVCQVCQTGYLLHDRVVRPSQVVISTGPPGDTQADAASSPPPSEEPA